MDKLNEYKILSGGYIYDILDKAAHKKVKEITGKNLTALGTINYLGEILPTEELSTNILYIRENGNKIFIGIELLGTDKVKTLAIVNFLFVKKS